jgi:hypothetical protein
MICLYVNVLVITETVLGLSYLAHEENEGQEMEEICYKSEDVHFIICIISILENIKLI